MFKFKAHFKPFSAAILLLLSGILFLLLRPEFANQYFNINDSAYHQLSSQLIAERILAFKNPFDFNIENWSAGFPNFSHYQMLPHFVVAGIYLLFFRLISILSIYRFVLVLLIMAYPWIYYFSLKRAGFKERQALAGAILSLASHSSIGYGIELSSYLSIGSGLFPQLFAMAIFPWALVVTYEFISGQKTRFLPPVFWLSVLTLSHLSTAYFAGLILGFLWLLGFCGKRVPSALRFGAMIILMGAMISFYLVPHLINAPYYNSYNRYYPLQKFDSHGIAWTLINLLNGNLFDANRLPILSLLVGLGFIVTLRRRRPESLMTAGFLLSLILFFGRTTWGDLLRLLPMAHDVQFERFIIGIHFFGTVLAGIALDWTLTWTSKIASAAIRGSAYLIIIGIISAGIFLPIYRYTRLDNKTLKVFQEYYHRDKGLHHRLFTALKTEDVGRVYAGKRSNWGQKFMLSGVPLYYNVSYEMLPVIGHLPFLGALVNDYSIWLDEERLDQFELFNVTHVISPPVKKMAKGVQLVFREGGYAVYRLQPNQMLEVVDLPIMLKADKYSYWNVVATWFDSQLLSQRQFLRICFEDCDETGFDRLIQARDLFHYRVRLKEKGRGKEFDQAAFEGDGGLGTYEKTNPTPAGEVGAWSKEDDRFKARVRLNRPAALLLKMNYHPFWRVEVDGQKARTILISPGYLGTIVSQGTHEVVFYYHPPAWKMILLTFLFLTPWLLFLLDRIRKQRFVMSRFAIPSGLSVLIILFISGIIGIGCLFIKEHYRKSVPLTKLTAVGEIPAESAQKSPQWNFIYRIPFEFAFLQNLEKKGVSQKRFILNDNYQYFEAWVGLSNPPGPCLEFPSVIFEVWVDDQLAQKTAPLLPTSLPRYILVPLQKKRILKLIIRGKGEFAECVRAVWGRASLFRR